MSRESTVTLEKFSGLNISSPPVALEDNELSSCINFNVGSAGELIKRTGFKQIHPPPTNDSIGNTTVTTALGHFLTGSFSQLLFRAGDNLSYSTDGITWTILPGGPHGDVQYGVQYTDKFYFVRKDNTILEWNGTTLTSIVGSPTGTFCRIHKDRLWVLNSNAVGNLASRLYFSAIGNLSAAGWISTNFIDINPGDGDILTALTNISEQILVFKGSTSWVLSVQSAPENWSLRNLSYEIGCISKYTVKNIVGVVYFLSLVGLYKTDGVTLVEVSTNINIVFSGQLLSRATANKASAFYWESVYMLCIENYAVDPTWGVFSSGTWESKNTSLWGELGATYLYYAYSVKNNSWTQWVITGFAPHTYIEVHETIALRGIYCGERSALGKLFKYGTSVYLDADIAYPCSFETKELTFDAPDSQKRGKKLSITQESTGDITVTNIVNRSIESSSTLMSSLSQLYSKHKGPGYFRSWRFKFNSTTENKIVFYDLTLALHRKRSVSKRAV